MKKLITTTLALIATMSISSQTMDIYRGDTLVATFTEERANKVVFRERNANDDAASQDASSFKFIHISDSHGNTLGTQKAQEFADGDNKIDFMFNTGDFMLFNSGIVDPTFYEKFAADKRWLMTVGNHDLDNPFYTATATFTQMTRPLIGDRVMFGDTSGNASYWYKDMNLRGNMLRIIGLDEYDYINNDDRYAQWSEAYSEKQINWLIDLLRNTPQDYYIIVAHHTPHGQRTTSGRSTYNGVENIFTSSGAPANYCNNNDDGEPAVGTAWNSNMICEILDKYLNKGVFEGTWNKGNKAGETYTFNESFADVTPAHFICHICGDAHWDICEYIENYPQQLQLAIDCDQDSRDNHSDCDRGAEGYLFNEVSVDFLKKQLTIKRHGTHVTKDGKEKTSITFDVKTM